MWRTIENTLRDLKELDPKTDITDNFLRVLVRDKKVKVMNSGTKAYIDFNSLLEYFNNPQVA